MVEEKKWELCLGGCGHWLKNKWGVCVGCYKKGHVGRSFECESGFVLCRGGCGVHVKVSTGACKLCVQKECQAGCNGVVPEANAACSGPLRVDSDDCVRSATSAGAASESQPSVVPVPVPGVKKFGIEVIMPEGADLQPVYGAS